MSDIIIVLTLWNLIVFAVFGADKWKAVHNNWRISEFALLAMCFLMGGAGGILGMYVWRHKTRKIKFRILVPLALLCNMAVLWALNRYIII